ncbi:MAG: ROK family protein [Candidatus Marinimicrobia bacterium]|nr:ROK family protein [Candidatus Neomarinimicrobiota bacterium]
MRIKNLIGVDLGGTKVRVGIVSGENYSIVGDTIRFDSYDCKTGDELVNRIAKNIEKLLKNNSHKKSDIKGIGIGSPGPLDPFTGTILETLNMKIMRNYPLKDKLEAIVGLTVFVDNDANAFGLGEQKAGKAQGKKHVLVATLGTGYGLAYILNGAILHGATGTATEIGRNVYRDGIYEDYISGRGLQSIHNKLHGEQVEPIKISERAFAGDVKCKKTFEEFGMHLAFTLVPIINMIDPEIVVIGGSIAVNWEFFSETLIKTIKENIFEQPSKNIVIEKSELGEFATLIGGASLVEMESVY